MYKIVVHAEEIEAHLFVPRVPKISLVKELKEIISHTNIEGVMSPKYKENYLNAAFKYASEELLSYFERAPTGEREVVLNIDFKFLTDDVRCSSTRLKHVIQYTYTLVSLWLTCLCERGVISKINYEKSLRVFPTSDVVGKNIHLLQHPVTKVVVFGATIDSLKKGIKLAGDNESKSLFKKIIEKIESTNRVGRRGDSKNYKPNSVYTFKFAMLKHGIVEALNYRNLLEVSDELTRNSGTVYQENPMRQILAESGYMRIDGKVATDAMLSHYYNRTHKKNSDSALLKLKIRQGSRVRGLSKWLSNSSIKIDGVPLYGCTELTNGEGRPIQAYGVYKKSILFRRKKDKGKNNEFHLLDKNSPEAKKFSEFSSYQRDYIKSKGSRLKSSTMKSYRGSLYYLNLYLIGFVYPQYEEDTCSPFNISGDGFLKSNLVPLFNDSELVLEKFRTDYSIEHYPQCFKDWLENEICLEDSFRVYGHVVDFFNYVQNTAIALGRSFLNPVPVDYSKKTSRSYKETSKNIFNVREWLVYRDVVNCLLDASLEVDYSKPDEVLSVFKNKIGESFKSDYLIGRYNFTNNLDLSSVDEAIENYNNQYQEGVGAFVGVETAKFGASIGALVITAYTGLRNNSVVYLQKHNLVVSQGHGFSEILVIQDKVHAQGFRAMCPTSELTRTISLMDRIAEFHPEFNNKRSREVSSNVYEEYSGLFGPENFVNEYSLSCVCDFSFYLFNAVCDFVNKTLKVKALKRIPLKAFVTNENSGTGVAKSFQHTGNTCAFNVDFDGPGESDDSDDSDFFNVDISLSSEDFINSLNPFTAVTFKPDLTAHSLRASLNSTNKVLGVDPSVTKASTGQETVTQNYYSKLTAENLELLKEGTQLRIAESMITANSSETDDKQLRDAVDSGVLASGGKVISLGEVVNSKKIETIYRENYKSISIHPTHICPHNDMCPSYISKELDYKKNCAICPVSVSFLTDLPAINQKIRFHLEEARSLKTGAELSAAEANSSNSMWETHFCEASYWMVRAELLISSGDVIAGENMIKDSKYALTKFSCEDNSLLGDLVNIVQLRGRKFYQSGELKSKAMFLNMALSASFDGLDLSLITTDPVEGVCRTIQKIMDVNKVSFEDLIKRLSTNESLRSSLGYETLLLGGDNG